MPPWMCRIPSLKSSLLNLRISPRLSIVSFSSTSTPKISLFDYLVNHQNFSPANVSSSSSTLYLNNPKNADSVLNFLKEIGFARNHIEAFVRRAPRFLSANVETTLKPKIKVFQDLGFHSSDLIDIISVSPRLLSNSAEMIRQSILGLKNVLGPNADICSFLKKTGSGWFVGYDLNRSLLPNIEYLKSCGVCPLQIASFVFQCPSKFVVKPEKLKGIVKRVDEMGVDRKSKAFLYAVKVMISMSRENWELKLNLIRELGFSEQHILVAFRRTPQVFTLSERKIKEVTQLLLSVEDISYIASNPVLLSFSVEKRLKPRLRVLKILESKNLLKKKPVLLAQFLKISDAAFIEKYVNPYSNEVGHLFALSQAS